MSAYRGDLDSVRARFDRLCEKAIAIRKDLEEILEALPILIQQFEQRGWTVAPPPTVALEPVPELNLDVTLKQALLRCQQVEQQIAGWERERDQLSEYARVLNDRLNGIQDSGLLKLGEPPRAVPLPLKLVNIVDWNWWHVWILAMWATTFIGVLTASRLAYGLVGALIALALLVLQMRKGLRRLALLRRGKVASVTGVDRTQSNTTSYSNMSVPTARGWEVVRESYSGSQYINRLRYSTDDGYLGELVLKGREYESGVVLYDTLAPRRALCISEFRGNPMPDHTGAWTHRPRVLDWVGAVSSLLLLVGYLVAMVCVAAYR